MTNPSYNVNQIAQELIETASGQAYHGNALKVSLDIPCINSSPEHKAVIQRYLRGSGAIESGDHITLHEAALLIRGNVKPRCPWPVHEWHPNAAYCSVFCGSRFYLFDKDDNCVEARDFKTAIDTKWTRAEALASQMLDKPDKVGVWLVYRDGKAFRSALVEDLIVYSKWGDRKKKYICDCNINGGFQFYYMGPLPEGEVRYE